MDSRSECPAPLAPFLGGEGLGVRGNPQRAFFCNCPPARWSEARQSRLSAHPSPPTPLPPKRGRGES